jgi:hypothetical protein
MKSQRIEHLHQNSLPRTIRTTGTTRAALGLTGSWSVGVLRSRILERLEITVQRESQSCGYLD